MHAFHSWAHAHHPDWVLFGCTILLGILVLELGPDSLFWRRPKVD